LFEVWGVGKNDNIEKVHLQFLKRILGVRVTTPNCLVYGELASNFNRNGGRNFRFEKITVLVLLKLTSSFHNLQ
jgi:hypothetical protein